MYLKKLMVTTILFIISASIIGCGGAYVADIAGDKISADEFEQVYAKNNGGWETASKTSLEEKQKFLELYVKFRLKVKDAYAHGYDKDPELKKELAEYRKNLAVSYLLDQEITKPALEKMYQRKLNEIRASHILIRVQPNASPEDTTAAYMTAKKIIDSLRMGMSFETLAVNNSQDPSAKVNQGDLYYFSTGMMVPEFEEAAYSLKAGEISPVPVRTQFGYHIIKVKSIQASQGPVQVSHIMKRLTQPVNPEDSIKAISELLNARDSILKGGDFGEFAKKISDDTYSAQRGGDIGFIERGRIVREFDQAMFALKDGEVSDIVRTQFGLHLIKRISSKGIPPYKDIEQQLKTDYQRNRFQHDYDNLVEKLKKADNFTLDSAAFKAFAASVDTSKTTSDATWDSTVSAEVRSKNLFTFANEKVNIDAVIADAKENQELQNLALKNSSTVNTIINKIGSGLVVEHYARQMETKFSDFMQIMKEYEEGVLLFKGEQENVWNKVAPSDSVLRLYHAENKAKYMWPDRVNVQEIYVRTDSLAQIVQNSLNGYTIDSLVAKKSKKGKSKKISYDTLKIAVAPISFDSAAAKYNKRGNTISSRGITGLQPVTTNEVTKQAWNWEEKDTLRYVPRDNGFSFIKILQKDPLREKTFEEAQSEVSGAYQESETKRLSDAWVESLKKKYPVQTFDETLKTTFTKAQPSTVKQ